VFLLSLGSGLYTTKWILTFVNSHSDRREQRLARKNVLQADLISAPGIQLSPSKLGQPPFRTHGELRTGNLAAPNLSYNLANPSNLLWIEP